jgi:catechol 2,3-dioxygenase-like lactoylglutathione lyase family enzyme
MPAPKLRALTPMAHVADIARSIRFYEQLGFRVGNTFQPDGGPALTWAWLASHGADLMVTLAEEPVDPGEQAVLFYLYCDDVQGMHAHLGEQPRTPST